MYTNDVHVGSLTCIRLEIGTRIQNQYFIESGAPRRTERLATSMLSDAHHLGACCQVIVQLSISGLHEIEAEQSFFRKLKFRFPDLSPQQTA